MKVCKSSSGPSNGPDLLGFWLLDIGLGLFFWLFLTLAFSPFLFFFLQVNGSCLWAYV